MVLLIGLGAYLWIQSQQAAVEEPAPGPVVVEQPTPEPEPEPMIIEPELEPEPVIPDPVQIQFAELAERPETKQLWPTTLELIDDIDLEIVYNGESFGEMTFTKGQDIRVRSLEAPANIVGKVGGQQLSIPVAKTNFKDWFENTHSSNFTLTDFESLINQTESRYKDISDQELYEELERWCLLNYGDCTLEIGPEKLTLHWKKPRGAVDYTEEATLLAHHYLKLQSERHQGDNYAPCEIVDIKTGKSLGFSAVFRPAETELN